MDAALEAVDRLNAHVSEHDADYGIALDRLLPFMLSGNVDAMYERMNPALKPRFLGDARAQWTVYHNVVYTTVEGGVDAKHWRALFEWLYRQPFALSPPEPLPPQAEAKSLDIVDLFVLVLPHLAAQSVDDVLDALPPRWRKSTLAKFAAGMRPGIDVILATCRAHGQDTTPFVKLMEWDAQSLIARPALSSR